MNNICEVCKATIDEQWSALQDEIKEKFKGFIIYKKSYAFTTRCIFCYKQYLERIEKDEHNWYMEVMRIAEKRFKW